MKKGGSIYWLKSFLSGCIVCLIILLLFSSALSQKKRISIGGAQAGGVHYPMAVGCAEIINRFLPDYNTIALETGGGLENLRLLGKEEIDIGFVNVRDATFAYMGKKPFTTPLKNLRLGFYLNITVLQIVGLGKTKIKTLEDLKGKIVSIGTPGSSTALCMEVLLGLHNISIKDLKVRHLGPSESMEALADGLIDASANLSAVPSSAVNSLAVKQKVRLVTADKKILEAAETKENIICFFIPPETYKGQSEGSFAWAFLGTAYYNERTSTEDVYQWTKAIMEHKDILYKVHPLGKEVRLVTKKEFESSPIPLHPGVIKYAKEVGINY